MENYKLGITVLLSTLFLSSCAPKATPQNITLEAGDLQLLDVLCQHEGIQRDDPQYTIKVSNDDDWIPFVAGETYNVTYEKASTETGKTEEKAISITITDTRKPEVLAKRAGNTHADIPHNDDAAVMEKAIMESVDDLFVVVDNSAALPIPVDKNNFKLLKFDQTLIDEPQEVSFSISDAAGNTSEATLEVVITKT